MEINWLEFLSGADAKAGFSADFETADNSETAAAARIVPLAHLGQIHAHGDDALDFLHNLLTNDVKGLGENDLRRAGFCTPKGRLLADFLVWRDANGVTLQVSADLLAPMLKKLSMYVLRAKVKLSDASVSSARIGLFGPQATALLARNGLPQPASMQQHAIDGGAILGLDSERFEIVVATEKAASLWALLRKDAAPAGISAWRAGDIAAGIPLITAATSEQFIPQMVNFELIGGVGFKKGCYPGQEIVARTQYLGKIKRRMYRAHVVSEPLAANTSVYSAETGDQACGAVVISAPAAGGGLDLLLVAQSNVVTGGDIHLGAPDGATLRILPLPYTVE